MYPRVVLCYMTWDYEAKACYTFLLLAKGISDPFFAPSGRKMLRLLDLGSRIL